MNLSPTVRTVLTIIAIVAGAVVTGLGVEGTIPPAVTIGLNAFNLVLGYLGVVPPQVGGTQKGVVSPSVTEPPGARIDERGYTLVEVGLFLLFLAIAVAIVAAFVA